VGWGAGVSSHKLPYLQWGFLDDRCRVLSRMKTKCVIEYGRSTVLFSDELP
jgi:hypothetical protein